MTRTPQGGLRIHAGIWTALLTLLLTATPLTAFAAPGTNQGQGAVHRSARATAALQAATELFQPKAAEARLGGHARDLAGVTAADNATMVLRDLAVSVPDLDPAQQQVARRILARPTDTDPIDPSGVKYPSDPALSGDTCTDPADVDHVCVHWVKDPSDPNAPAAVDENGNGVPDWVETTQQVFGDVWQHIVGDLGYRAPMSDLGTADPGIDGRTDIYLADLRPYNLYGYCVPEWVDGSSVRYPAYCVVDNDFQDYSAGPLASLEVTAAHEFFHAVQFGYDVDADTWVMEGTAAWMEDEVYDGINDNLQYLPWSPLHAPAAPLDLLDTGDHTNAWQYGSWIWWRFLGEYFGAGKAEDATVVRQVWQRIGAGERSLQALNNVIRNHGASFGSLFATFGAVNYRPQQWYAEGASYAKYAAPAAGRFTLTKTRPGTPWLMTRLDHLSNATAVLRPGTGLSGAWRLRVVLDLPPTYRGSRATITVHRTDGRTPRFPVTLNSKGDGALAVPFGKTSVAQVVLTVTNASTRISSCGSGRQWSCGGIPVDNRLPFSFRARAIR